MAFIPNKNLVNKSLADRSHAGTSYDPEKRAEQEIEGFGGYVSSVYDELRKHAKTEAQQTFLDTEMARFQTGFAAKYNDLLAAKGRTISSFITGGSNFPIRRAEKANSAEDKRYQEMIEFRDKAQAAILRELKKMAVSEAGGEVEVLKAKIEKAEKLQEMMVEVNKIIRRQAIGDADKIAQIVKLGLQESTARKLLIPDYMGRIGFPAFELQNNNARIRSMKERIGELEKKEATPSADIAFEGGTMHDSKEDDRIQLFFDQKPPQAMIDKLKGEGWRWSPAMHAWQRKRTDNALFSARRILGLEAQNPIFVPVKEAPIPTDAEFEKAKLFLSSLAMARTLDELVGWQPAVKRWSIKFPELEKELESEYQARFDYLKAVKETAEAERKEKASKPQSEQAKDLYKQMRKTNSVRELDDWRNRVLFEAHLSDVEEDILLRELSAKWRVYLESRGIPALEKLDKLPLDYKDEDYYFGTEVYVHPTTTIFDDLPYKGIIHEARNGGELWEVARVGSEGEGTSRVPIERLYVTKLVEKPEPRYQPPSLLRTALSPEYLDWLKVELHRSDDPIIAESKKNKGFRLFVKSIDEVKKEFVVEKDVYINHANGIVSEMPGTEYNRGKKYPIENFDIMPFSDYLKKEGIKFQYKESLNIKYVIVHWNGGEGWTLEYKPDKKEYSTVNTKNFLALDEINKLLNSGEAKLYVYETRGEEFFRWKPFTVPYPEFKWHSYFTENGKNDGRFYELLHATYESLRNIWMWSVSVTDAEQYHKSEEISEPQLKASFTPIEKWRVREADILTFLKKYDTPTWDTSLHFIEDSIRSYKESIQKFPIAERDKYELILDTLKSRVRAKIEADKQPKPLDTQEIRKRAKAVAEWWFNSQMKNPFTEFYLYHKIGDFRVAIETPDGYKLSDAQRISPAWTKEQAEQWIFDKVQKLPILPLMPVPALPLYSPRAEPTYQEIVRTQEIKGWTVRYEFKWQSAMGYYSGFIWVNRGIGEGIRTAVIHIKSANEIPAEIDKAIAEAEKVTQKPIDYTEDTAIKETFQTSKEAKERKFQLELKGYLIKEDIEEDHSVFGKPKFIIAYIPENKPAYKGFKKIVEKPKFVVENPFGVDLSKSIVPYPTQPIEERHLEYRVNLNRLKELAVTVLTKYQLPNIFLGGSQSPKSKHFPKKESDIDFSSAMWGKEFLEYVEKVNASAELSKLYQQCRPAHNCLAIETIDGLKIHLLVEPIYQEEFRPLVEDMILLAGKIPVKIMPNVNSSDYKAGYNLAIQGRIAPAVPAWTDQGIAEFKQGYDDGMKAKKEIPVFGLPQDTKTVIEEFGKSVQALPEKPRVIGAPSRQEQTERELRIKAQEGKRLKGQQVLTSAISTSKRLSAFEEKPIIPQQPVKSMVSEEQKKKLELAKAKTESLLAEEARLAQELKEAQRLLDE